MEKLQRDFYNRDTLEVSRDVLGKYLVHEVHGRRLMGRIVESEAYKGAEDKASHAFGGKMTPRNKVMFGPPGYAYIYIIYGMYNCLNLVTEPEGLACAVLIRAVEPVEGFNEMALARYGQDYKNLDSKSKIGLTNGPGKLCMALGITTDLNQADLTDSQLYLLQGDENEEFSIAASPRINIDYAGEAARYPWRFYIEGNKYVSKRRML